MRDADSCPMWRPHECNGTDECPPRCPRYVAPDGTAYTVYSHDDCPTALLDAMGETFEAPPNATLTLVVTDGDDLIGRATLTEEDPADSPERTTAGRGVIELVADDPAAGAELGRQLVARADALALQTLSIEGAPEVLDRLGDELAVERNEGQLTVPLGTPLVETMSLPPSRRGDITASLDLSSLVAPDSVAVVGATDRENAIGRVVMENLLSSFDGDVIPVTPRRDEVLGIPAIDSLADADVPPDLAVIILPAAAALDAVRTAGSAGVEAVAVLSAGFGETGDSGRRREAELREIADAHDLVLIGPNALGLLNPWKGLNASFAPVMPDPGSVSIVSHSGALITAALDWAAATGVGVNNAVSLGNAAGIDEAELLRYWGNDPDTEVVFAYLEDVADGDRFVEAAREVSASTPIVVLKSGRSEAGARAAASHTGALVEDDSGFDAAFDAAGVVRARSLEEAFDLTKAFTRQPSPMGDRVAVVSNAGGPAVLTTDAIDEVDLTLASFSEETTARLGESLPDAASVSNPVDVLGDAEVDRIGTALEICLADPNVDAAIVVSTPHPLVSQSDLVRAVGAASRRYGKPVVTCLSGGPTPEDVHQALNAASLPNYSDPTRAAETLATMAAYTDRRRRPSEDPVRPLADREQVQSVLRHTMVEGSGALGVDAMELLDAYGIPTPRDELARTRTEAVEAAQRMDSDVVLKVASPDIAHKTDVGGVRVGVSPTEVGQVYDEIIEDVEAVAPDAEIEGILVQEMVSDGVECLIGVTRHSRFGAVVTFGLGGVFVEHLEDVVHGLAPLSHAEALRLVQGIDGASILEGARGAEGVDLDAIADALVRLSWFALDHPVVEEFEVNPLVATPDGVCALDFQLSLDRGSLESSDSTTNRARREE